MTRRLVNLATLLSLLLCVAAVGLRVWSHLQYQHVSRGTGDYRAYVAPAGDDHDRAGQVP